MPPNRSHVKTFTPVKTERSHQENQERAYVAASRRSDRSLEARIESARRASEIHKQRTGRSLRITESAVVNEEMYEEDDDDLPAHMRRLTAHLRLNQQDADLDRRLGSLLVSQIGMRQALPMTQQANFYRYAPNGAQPSAFAPNSSYQTLGHSRLPWSLQTSAIHARHASMSSEAISPSQVSVMSPTTPYAVPHSPQQAPTQGDAEAQLPYQASFSSHERRHSTASAMQSPTQAPPPALHSPAQDMSPFVYGSPLHQDPDSTLFPLSATLPLETQQMLVGSHLDFNDPTLGMLMHGSEDFLRSTSTNYKDGKDGETVDENSDEQFGAFWNDVMLGM